MGISSGSPHLIAGMRVQSDASQEKTNKMEKILLLASRNISNDNFSHNDNDDNDDNDDDDDISLRWQERSGPNH